MVYLPKSGEIMIRKEIVQKFCDDACNPDYYCENDNVPSWIKEVNKDELEYFSNLDKETADKIMKEASCNI